jgi:hypothetical protein
MKTKVAALAVWLAMGISTQALSQTPTHDTSIIGFLKTSCGTWTQARTYPQSESMEYWALGFVSGANSALSVVEPDFLKNVGDCNALFGWIDNYCRSKPLDLFPIAVANLVNELRTRPQ